MIISFERLHLTRTSPKLSYLNVSFYLLCTIFSIIHIRKYVKRLTYTCTICYKGV